MTTVTLDTAPKPRTARPALRAVRARARTVGLYALSVVLGVAVWQVLAAHYGPSLVASPRETLSAARELAADGTLGN
ncbi:ABC transporter permease, partial [Streptomyces sp. NPDC002920]